MHKPKMSEDEKLSILHAFHTNNDISNLVMLSQADHFKVHQFIRKVQRLSR